MNSARSLLQPPPRLAAGLFVALLALVLWGSLGPYAGPGGGRFDKLQHFGAHAALALLGFAILRRRSWRLLLTLVLLGLGIEGLQALPVIGRQASWLDVAANLAGALSAWAARWLTERPR